MLVDRDHPFEVLDAGFGEGPEDHQPGIVHQDVEPAERLDGLGDSGFCLGPVGDVGGYGQRCHAGFLNLGHELIKAVLTAGDKSDGSALAGELKGSGVADAAAGTGNDRDGPGKSGSHSSVLQIHTSDRVLALIQKNQKGLARKSDRRKRC